MLAAGFHATRRHDPDFLVPDRSPPTSLQSSHWSSPRSGSQIRAPAPQRLPARSSSIMKRSTARQRQGLMMLDLLDLRPRRQQLVEMSTPAGRIFAVAIAAHSRPIEHGFDPSAQPAGRLGLGVQIGSSTFMTSPVSITCTAGRRSSDRRSAERRLPLSRVLDVAPAGAVRGDVPLGGVLERHGLSGIGAQRCAGSGTFREGIMASAFGDAPLWPSLVPAGARFRDKARTPSRAEPC